MDVHMAQELLNELGSSLENLETQQAALLQLLKDKRIVTNEELAPYLNQAGNASSVRWRAAHLRLEHIFSAAAQKEQQAGKPEERKIAGTQAPGNNQKDGEAGKPSKSDTKPVASEEARPKKEKAESSEPRPQASGREAKAQSTESSTQRREEDAA